MDRPQVGHNNCSFGNSEASELCQKEKKYMIKVKVRYRTRYFMNYVGTTEYMFMLDEG